MVAAGPKPRLAGFKSNTRETTSDFPIENYRPRLVYKLVLQKYVKLWLRIYAALQAFEYVQEKNREREIKTKKERTMTDTKRKH